MEKVIDIPFVRERVQQQIRKPTSGFWGFVTKKYLLQSNAALVQHTARALNCGPDDNILECGFGLGGGLKYVLENNIKNGSGHLYGLDYSADVCKWARRTFKKYIECGKLTILNEDVAKMSLPDSAFDKVFHVYCYHFWDDMVQTVKEIKRVMKPGAVILAGKEPAKLEFERERNLLESWQYDSKRYMDALAEAGFTHIREDTTYNDEMKTNFNLIFATKPK